MLSLLKSLFIHFILIEVLSTFLFFLIPKYSLSIPNNLEKVINEIIYEACLEENSSTGKPLPLASHWNTGIIPEGFSPEYQIKLIEKNHFVLPALCMPGHTKIKKEYFIESIKKISQLKLPLTFISTQWESILTENKEFFLLPPEKNPNVVKLDGSIHKMVSPFGPKELWEVAGKIRVSNDLFSSIAKQYPDPPLIIFISNNEHPKLKWYEVEESKRYIEIYGYNRDENFKRKIVGDGWIERYRALIKGMRENLPHQWKYTKKIFIGYNAFSTDAFGRWSDWINYSLYIPGRLEPWVYVWDGASISYYIYDWDPSTDFTFWSPQIRAMNYPFMIEEFKKINPQFWIELTVWDGYEPKKDTNKRKYFERLGQFYTPERYAGFVQFGMWLIRPRLVREFRSWNQTVEDNENYFLALIDSVDKIHTNNLLKRFWRYGKLVPNDSRQHPSSYNIPDEFKFKNRWFLLDTNLDPKWPWNLNTEIPIFSIVLLLGNKPNREWLLYTFSPVQERNSIMIKIPNYKAVKVSSTPQGKFFYIRENENLIKELKF